MDWDAWKSLRQKTRGDECDRLRQMGLRHTADELERIGNLPRASQPQKEGSGEG